MTDGRRLSCKPFRANLDGRLTPGDHRVLDALGGHANTTTGEVYAGSEALRAHARIGDKPMSERGFLKCTDHLVALGYVVKRKVDGRNHYWVLYDVRKATPTSDTGTHGPVLGPEPGFRADAESGTGVPVDRNGGSGGTGTGVPGERVNSTELQTTGTDARAREDRNTGSGVASDTDKRHRTEVSGIEEEEDDMDPALKEMATKLSVAVNAALRDNPNTRRQAEIHLLPAGLAMTPLTDWLAAGIAFDLILRTCVEVATRYTPGQPGDRISRFTYFDRPIHEAHAKAEAKEQLEAAPTTRPAGVVKIRRFA